MLDRLRKITKSVSPFIIIAGTGFVLGNEMIDISRNRVSKSIEYGRKESLGIGASWVLGLYAGMCFNRGKEKTY